MSLKNDKLEILKKAKLYASENGWNDNLFMTIAKFSKFNYHEIIALFPNGCLDLIEMYLEEINKEMTLQSQKINLIQLRVHERIKELFILRLKIMLKEKKLISKTFFYLLMPQNYKHTSKILYKTVDQMWFLAGDNSTDFNFYSKRMILSSIYFIVMVHFINNENIEETISILNKQLKRVSKIPSIKNKFQNTKAVISQIFKFRKGFSYFKQ
jgi:ubiquinone biosynthesis protein COQ9